jgi:RNase P/RNase MRP subunit p29
MTARANPQEATQASTPEESPFLTKAGSSDAKAETPPPVDANSTAEMPKSPVPESATPPFGTTPELFPYPPKIDSEAHKPDVADTSAAKVDPEAHRPAPAPSKEITVTPETPSKEKREFHLTNGEHVAGVVLSETPEAIYVEHATLGVITVPRKEIAKRLVEIILINGDRIVGDIMAESADTLYVRHASLGMLSVPRAQRSTRVVEAILKDGDRILGEVLTETETFTVIRSATLGTITVPHTKLAMLNRKVEQIEMKSLPPSVPELKDKE